MPTFHQITFQAIPLSQANFQYLKEILRVLLELGRSRRPHRLVYGGPKTQSSSRLDVQTKSNVFDIIISFKSW